MNEFYARTMLNTQRLQEETGLTPAQILALPSDEYARLTGRLSVSQIAAQAAGIEPPGRPRREPVAAQTAPQPQPPEAQGIDVAALSMEQYAAVRGQLGVGRSHGEGKGIFDSVGSRSDEYTAAVRAQSGRTGWTTSNVVESPRLERRYARPDVQPDTRPAVQRFSTPGNSYGSE